jgi:hypothetical protein
VRHPSSPCGQGTAPSFYRPRGGSLQSCHTVLATCGGMVYSVTEWMAILANLASGGALLRTLCPSRSSFEGSGVGASPFRLSCMRQLKGWADGRPGVAQRWTWRRLVVLSPIAPGMELQCSGWWRSGGDGRTGPMATEEMRLSGPTSWRRPVCARDRRSYPFQGFYHPLSRVRCVGRTRVGSTVSQS